MPRPHSDILVGLLRDVRFEVFPSETVADRLGHLPEGAKVPITCSPSRGVEATLKLSRRLLEHGLRPVPHLSARVVTGPDHVRFLVEELDDQGVEDVLVIGGDSEVPAGPYHSALSLLRGLEEAGYRFRECGVAGYPEGHPHIDDRTLQVALDDKLRHATYLVTQMCFDSDAIVEWIRRIRERGIGLPVYVGIPGAADALRLTRLAGRIGVGDSRRFLRAHRGLLGRLLRPGYAPDRLVSAIAVHAADPSLGIRGFHIYTFNQLERTERWRGRLLDRLRPPSNEGGARG